LFFVISGLCIRLAHRGAGEFSVGHFYWRRFWRIYPAYLISLLLFAALQHYQNIRDILAHLFLVHNFSLSYLYSINRPFWSLALEVQVYLLYPVLLLMHKRWGVVRTGTVLFGLYLASYGLGSQAVCQRLHWPALAVAQHLPTRLWFTWYAGFLLAEAFSANLRPSHSSRIILCALLLLFPLVRVYRPLMTIQTPVAGIILTLLAWEYLNMNLNLGLPGKWLASLGACSYSFYLYFDQLVDPILKMLSSQGHLSFNAIRFGIGYPVVLLSIFIFSFFAHRFVELPSISIGRKLYPRLHTQPAEAGAAQG